MKRIFLLSIIAVLGCSCATTYRLPKEIDIMTKDHEIPEGKALVYILRPNTYAWAVQRLIFCEQQYFGRLGAKSYIFGVFDPGEYTFHVQVDKPEYKEVKFKFEPDKKYFLKTTIDYLTWTSDATTLTELPSDYVKYSIKKCKLSSTPTYITVTTNISPNVLSGIFVKHDFSYLYLNKSGKTLKINFNLIESVHNYAPDKFFPSLIYKNGYIKEVIIPCVDFITGDCESIEKYIQFDRLYEMWKYDSNGDYTPMPYFNPLNETVEINTAEDFPY